MKNYIVNLVLHHLGRRVDYSSRRNENLVVAWFLVGEESIGGDKRATISRLRVINHIGRLGGGPEP
jgi:hypothetical protein